jgi:sec-independent protein translocase protein TatC
MPLIDHLIELRKRFVISMAAAILGMIIAFFFHEEIWEKLAAPLTRALEQSGKGTMAVHTILEGIMNKIKVSALAGLLISSPVIITQIWLFVAPGLYAKEKRFIIPLSFASTFLFLVGIGFGYFVIFDFVFPFLLEQSDDNIQAVLSINDYLSTATKLLVGFGACFQLPVVAFFLARAGLIDHKDMIKFFRYAIVAIFIVAAFLTPPDPISQVLMAVPLVLLYAIGIVVAWLFSTKGKKEELTPE